MVKKILITGFVISTLILILLATNIAGRIYIAYYFENQYIQTLRPVENIVCINFSNPNGAGISVTHKYALFTQLYGKFTAYRLQGFEFFDSEGNNISMKNLWKISKVCKQYDGLITVHTNSRFNQWL